jgi:predicted anti-sigma-YlaC factor YlaD
MSARLTCRECSDFLADYRDDTLDAQVRATFEMHLDKCRNCREYLTQYEAAITVSKSACAKQTDDALHSFPEELVKAILAARRDT